MTRGMFVAMVLALFAIWGGLHIVCDIGALLWHLHTGLTHILSGVQS